MQTSFGFPDPVSRVESFQESWVKCLEKLVQMHSKSIPL